jgi:hypothetical protein
MEGLRINSKSQRATFSDIANRSVRDWIHATQFHGLMHSYQNIEPQHIQDEDLAQKSFQVDPDPDITVFSHDDAEDDMIGHKVDSDNDVLVALGYRQEFKRKFTVWSIFCLSFSSLGLLSSIAATLTFTLGFNPSLLH